MTPTTPQTPIFKAGLTKWAMPFDRAAGARTPQLPEDPGTVHAVRPVATELGIKEPHFIEDTWGYRAALCGAKVKVIMPNTFKTEEPDACADCIAESLNPIQESPTRPGAGLTSRTTKNAEFTSKNASTANRRPSTVKSG